MINADGRGSTRRGTSMRHSHGAVRSRTVLLGEFHAEQVRRLAHAESCSENEVLARALDLYLDESARRPGWEFPKFLGADPALVADGGLVVEVNADSWGRLSEEGARQQVEPELLARHALSFALAERQRRGSSTL